MAMKAQDARVVLRKESEWIVRQPKARQAKSKFRQVPPPHPPFSASNANIDHVSSFNALQCIH